MRKIVCPKRAVFQICRLLLLAVICVLFNNPIIFAPALALMTANIIYLCSLLKRKGFWRRCFAAINICAGAMLCSRLMIDNMPRLPRFVEREPWPWLGPDAAAALWTVFWISHFAYAIAYRCAGKNKNISPDT